MHEQPGGPGSGKREGRDGGLGVAVAVRSSAALAVHVGFDNGTTEWFEESSEAARNR